MMDGSLRAFALVTLAAASMAKKPKRSKPDTGKLQSLRLTPVLSLTALLENLQIEKDTRDFGFAADPPNLISNTPRRPWFFGKLPIFGTI
jgi:hypothetical protein